MASIHRISIDHLLENAIKTSIYAAIAWAMFQILAKQDDSRWISADIDQPDPQRA
jgi:hypothetical protein